jgi:hypothetical protein
MKILKYLACITLLLYWVVTFLYNSPNNPIRIHFSKELSLFGIVFPQKWDFFAPPPQANNKLYYSYFDENKKNIGTFEVLSPIIKEKKDKIPFNTQAEAIDYVISSTFTNVLNSIVHKDKEYKYLHKNKSPEKTYQMAVKSVLKNIDKTHEFVTLLNFSRIIRQKNLGKNVKVRYIKMIFAEEKIKKFINRDDKAAVVRNLLLETNFIDFKDE